MWKLPSDVGDLAEMEDDCFVVIGFFSLAIE
jgi:hypothetical protein